MQTPGIIRESLVFSHDGRILDKGTDTLISPGMIHPL